MVTLAEDRLLSIDEVASLLGSTKLTGMRSLLVTSCETWCR